MPGWWSRRPSAVNVEDQPRRREAMDIVKLIDAHGGRLGVFRASQVRPPASLPSEQRPQQREEGTVRTSASVRAPRPNPENRVTPEITKATTGADQVSS
jgi:hypothetical protein